MFTPFAQKIVVKGSQLSGARSQKGKLDLLSPVSCLPLRGKARKIMERLNPINMSLEPTDPLKERSIIFCRQVGNITDMHARLTISLVTPYSFPQESARHGYGG